MDEAGYMDTFEKNEDEENRKKSYLKVENLLNENYQRLETKSKLIFSLKEIFLQSSR